MKATGGGRDWSGHYRPGERPATETPFPSLTPTASPTPSATPLPAQTAPSLHIDPSILVRLLQHGHLKRLIAWGIPQAQLEGLLRQNPTPHPAVSAARVMAAAAPVAACAAWQPLWDRSVDTTGLPRYSILHDLHDLGSSLEQVYLNNAAGPTTYYGVQVDKADGAPIGAPYGIQGPPDGVTRNILSDGGYVEFVPGQVQDSPGINLHVIQITRFQADGQVVWGPSTAAMDDHYSIMGTAFVVDESADAVRVVARGDAVISNGVYPPKIQMITLSLAGGQQSSRRDLSDDYFKDGGISDIAARGGKTYISGWQLRIMPPSLYESVGWVSVLEGSGRADHYQIGSFWSGLTLTADGSFAVADYDVAGRSLTLFSSAAVPLWTQSTPDPPGYPVPWDLRPFVAGDDKVGLIAELAVADFASFTLYLSLHALSDGQADDAGSIRDMGGNILYGPLAGDWPNLYLAGVDGNDLGWELKGEWACAGAPTVTPTPDGVCRVSLQMPPDLTVGAVHTVLVTCTPAEVTASKTITPDVTTTPSATSTRSPSGTVSVTATTTRTQGPCQAANYHPMAPVTKYFQSDPRWSNEPLDGSTDPKDTLGWRGCFVTCFAMFTGSTPKEMEDDLTDVGAITSNGQLIPDRAAESLGWDPTSKYLPNPSQGDLEAALATGNANYFAEVQSPSSGKSHFVVIVGEEFDSSTGRCRIVIDDPSRTRNYRYLDQYSTWYSIRGYQP